MRKQPHQLRASSRAHVGCGSAECGCAGGVDGGGTLARGAVVKLVGVTHCSAVFVSYNAWKQRSKDGEKFIIWRLRDSNRVHLADLARARGVADGGG